MNATMLLLVLGAAATAYDSLCELPRVDRRSTPSERCLTCHDGTVGPVVPTTLIRGLLGSHPVRIEYLEAAEGPGSLRPRTTIPGEITLPYGRVECVSCHDGRDSGRGRVAVAAAELCTACHAM